MMIFTDRAVQRVQEFLASRGGGGEGSEGLRVSAQRREGRLPGYRLLFSPGPDPADVVVPFDGFRAFVDPVSAGLLSGVRIDFVNGPSGAGFRFRPPADPTTISRVRSVLDGVRPMLRADGGDVELVAVWAGEVEVRMTGACSGCSTAANTLAFLVGRQIQDAVPEIRRVVPVP